MGLTQSDRNAIVPGKRMLSSMTPTIVLDSAGAPMLVTGAAGGAFIITSVTHLLISVLDFDRTLDEAMRAPQFHQQDVPDSLTMEKGPWADSMKSVMAPLGNPVSTTSNGWDTLAFVQSIMRVGGRWVGVSEPRGHGLARGY
jgi:gamma-glutamyltranspeptidase/glutathione hydrolase